MKRFIEAFPNWLWGIIAALALVAVGFNLGEKSCERTPAAAIQSQEQAQ